MFNCWIWSWTSIEGTKINRRNAEEKLLGCVNSDTLLKAKTYLLLSFMFSKEDVSKRLDLIVALTYVDWVLESTEFSDGEKWLATANKSHILQKMNRTGESFRWRQIATAGFGALQNIEKSKVFACKAFAIKEVNQYRHDDVIAACDAALRCDKTNGEAHFVKGLQMTMKRTGGTQSRKERQCYDRAAKRPESPATRLQGQ